MIWLALIGVAIYITMLCVVWRRAGKQHITESDRRVLALFANFSLPDPPSATKIEASAGALNQQHLPADVNQSNLPEVLAKPKARGAAGGP
ncbi:MAG: hypothetical protein ACJ74Z_03100 [Bryobacteraceae bacterium]